MTSALLALAVAQFLDVTATTTHPTRAWSAFCREQPAECTVNPTEPRRIHLTSRAWETLVQTNRAVNDEIKVEAEAPGKDVWLYPETTGDCEDVQLEKRARLIQEGFPRRALNMAVVYTPWNEGHVVLVVRTDHGDIILDNLDDMPVTLDRSPHRMSYIESQERSFTWNRVNPVDTAR